MRMKFVTCLCALAMIVAFGAPLSSVHAGGSTGRHLSAVSAQSIVAVRPQLFDKTRFLLHTGVAFFAFHHFVLQRYHNGGFAPGAKGRTLNFVKAAIALAFAYHELHVAYDIANGSNSKTLHLLVTPINALLSKFNLVKNDLGKGNYNAGDITGLNSAVNGLGAQAQTNGYTIHDVPITVPGAA